MRIGYARVSTHDQDLALQKDALKKAGCEKIVVDVASGKKERRSGLDRARDLLRKGDVLVVWRLDRLGRSLKHLIELMNEMERAGIGFCCSSRFWGRGADVHMSWRAARLSWQAQH